MSDQRTVRVATCHDPAEATMIRMVLRAHGIDAMIPGESAASLGTTAVGFRTHVFVHAEHAEEAEALINEMREGGEAQGASDDGEGGEDDGDGDADGEAGRSLEPRRDVGVVVDRRKRLGATVLFALVLGFGTGHMSTGAWKRGFALAALELVGIRHAAVGHRYGVVLVAAAVLIDLIGAVMRVRRRGGPAPLPAAIVRGSRSRGRS